MRRSMLGLLTANIILFFIGILDLTTTLWWVQTGRATEVNPIMAGVLKLGIPMFVAVKLLTLLGYVIMMEWYRRRRDAALARAICVSTLISYAGIYTVSFVLVNHRFLLG